MKKKTVTGFIGVTCAAVLCCNPLLSSAEGYALTQTQENVKEAVKEIVNTQVSAFVERMYTVALGRTAEKDGCDWWSGVLLNGDSDGAGLAYGFLLGDEFKSKNYSNADYVKVLYATFFDRVPEAEEVSFWVSGLEYGTSRESVLSGFVNSTEFFNLCASFGISRGIMHEDGTIVNSGIGKFAERLYTRVLERAGDEGGVEFWANSIANGDCTPEKAAKEFFQSDEYLAKNSSDEDYIKALYLTFMDRECDEGGLAYWVSALNTGVPRSAILSDFAASDEFKNIMKKFGLVEDSYTYKDSVGTLTTNWNPHTYQSTDDSYLEDYIRSGFYEFVFNDELHAVEGKEPYSGYKIIPLMAASEPVDVTVAIKNSYPQYNIPASAKSGYAYTIDLNPEAVWEDGTPINADSYVYSMQQLLDVTKQNSRASNYYSGDLVIAGAENYANSGLMVRKANSTDGEVMTYALAALVKGADGTYTTQEGYKAYFGLNEEYAWLGGESLSKYYNSGYIPYQNCWAVLSAAADADGFVPVTDETIAALYVFTGSDTWENETKEQLGYYISYDYIYPTVDYSTVGLFKSGDYQITIVFGKPLSGFDLLYNLTTTWLVKEDLYEACQSYKNGTYSTTYNTNVDTTSSYGPYKLVEYNQNSGLRLEKNEKWVGFLDDQHMYKDPVDGKYYEMYQTTAIECKVVNYTSTKKSMFLKGQLTGYQLTANDFATYRDSEYCYALPGSTTFFMILNGHIDAIQEREADSSFNKATQDLETLTNISFRKAMAVTFDKDLFASTVSPARSAGYGIIGSAYVYDPETGTKYRDTNQAKQVLCEFYSVDVSQYSSLDAAVDSITGYDPETAKALFKQAYHECIAVGYITDTNKDGICDQTISIEYALSEDSTFITNTIKYLNSKLDDVLESTPFEGKIEIVKSEEYGAEWSNMIRTGLADIVLGGWSGSLLNPFSLTDLYTNQSRMYDAEWFKAETVKMELEIGGEKVTMNLKQWSDAVNGNTVTVNGKEYNFGVDFASADDRLTILAAIEGEILSTYNYIPMLEDAGMYLLSQQVYYVIEDYNPVMGRGGIQYMRYNYNDEEWAAYVESQGGELLY